MRLPKPSYIVPLNFNSAIFGILLAIASFFTIALVSHHPAAEMHDISTGLENIRAIDAQGRMVHGILIVMVMLSGIGFTGFAIRLNIANPLVLTGAISYWFGVFAMIFSATMDGFVLADIASKFSQDNQMGYAFINFSMMMVQAIAKVGFALMGSSAILWGLALIHFSGLNRIFGALGVLIGAFCLGFILLSTKQIDVRILFYYTVLQIVWHFIIAYWLIFIPKENVETK